MKKLIFVITVILCLSYVNSPGLKAETSDEIQVERMPDLPKKMERLNSVLKDLNDRVK